MVSTTSPFPPSRTRSSSDRRADTELHPMTDRTITFFYPFPDDLAKIDRLDLDDWRFWSASWLSRRRGWCLRTALTLQKRGYPVRISATLPEKGIVVVGPEVGIRKAFLDFPWSARRNLFVVAIRADLLRCTFADVEIVQNGKFADNRRSFHVPHWPQPDLRPRSSERGTTVQSISFKGYYQNLSPDFRSAEWKQFLDANGFSLRKAMNASGEVGEPIPWHDYSNTDVLLAVRPDMTDAYFDKPATKLVNAWLAGVPAILGPEYAYREIRESSLDYIEVTSLEETMDALLRLKSNPDLYRAMVENGLKRAEEHDAEHVARRWEEVLFEKIAPMAQRRFRTSRLPVPLSRVVNLVAHPPSAAELSVVSRTTQSYMTWLVQSQIRPWLGRKRRRLQSMLAL